MLYTVLGLYDPAELALDTCLISDRPLTPRLCVLEKVQAPSRMPVRRVTDPNQLGTASVDNARVC
jgi:hypothetical protein